MAHRTRHRKNRKNRNSRRRRMSGGNLGAGYSVGPEVLVKGMPYLVNDGSVGNCQAVAPSYALKDVPAIGLPGMSGPGPLPGFSGPTLAMKGGRRRKSRKGRRNSRKQAGYPAQTGYPAQAGGRYEISPVPVGGMDTPNIQASWNRIACENGAIVPGGPSHVSPTPPTQPGYASLPGAVPGVNPVTNYVYGSAATAAPVMKGGRRTNLLQAGGALTPPYSGGTPLEETTAGYTHLRSAADAVVTQAGVPVMFNVPSGGRLGESSACVKTGGRRKSSHKNRKSRKASRKNRKNRKNRK